MKMKINLFLSVMMILTLLAGCASTKPTTTSETESSETTSAEDKKVNVVATIFPQYDFVREIAGDQVDLTMLLPPGSESHSYEPTPQDIIKIQNCDVFIYVGGESDAWVDKILDSMDTSNMKIISMMDYVDVVEEELVEGMEEDHGHSHGEIDPDNVKDRKLSDFDGNWTSLSKSLEKGILTDYIKYKSSDSDMNEQEYLEYLNNRWNSDFIELSINGEQVTIDGQNTASYDYKGFEVIEKEEHVSVWYLYEIQQETDQMPKYLAFNDHQDGNPEEHDEEEEHDHLAHMHLRYGNDGFDALLAEQNWSPTFFDSDATDEELVEALMPHEETEEAELDEHVWTSPKNAQLIVQGISNALCEVDPANKSDYEKNTASYLKQLQELDTAFQNVVKNGARNTIIFGDRFPLRYFADAYGLTYYAAFPGCSTETEASAATVAFLIDKVKEEDIPVVFYLELSNQKMADTICESTGASKLLFHSCHNVSKSDIEKGVSYLELMTQNVENLKEALQ